MPYSKAFWLIELNSTQPPGYYTSKTCLFVYQWDDEDMPRGTLGKISNEMDRLNQRYADLVIPRDIYFPWVNWKSAAVNYSRNQSLIS